MAVQQNPTIEGDSEPRWEAYRLISELLLGFRKILQRALFKAVGDDWWSSGCPEPVTERIARRRGAEVEVERFGLVEDDPMAYTTFLDLAELMAANPAVGTMVGGLSLSPDDLVSDLRTLEDVRLKVAAARALSETESVVLAEMHLRLREKLTSARLRRTGSVPDDAEADPAVEAADSAGAKRQGPDVAEPGPDEGASPAGPSEGPALAAEATVPVEVGAASDPAPSSRAARARAGEIFDGAATPVGLVDVAPGDLEVLRELRLEIIAAAEAAYSYSDEIDTTVWDRETECGWFADKIDAYGLGDVATFYAVLEGYQDRRGRGSNREALRTFLADRELAKLLLRLRELFIRLRV